MGDHIDNLAHLDNQFSSSNQDRSALLTSFISSKEIADLEMLRDLRLKGIITTPGAPFEEAHSQEIDSLIARDIFEFVKWDPDGKHAVVRVFNSRLVNEVKGRNTDKPYEKSRLVVQAHNDEGKKYNLDAIANYSTFQPANYRCIGTVIPEKGYFAVYLRCNTGVYPSDY